MVANRSKEPHKSLRLVAYCPDSYVVFDLETIADRADQREHEIIEIGAVLASGDRVLDQFQTLVRPTRPLGDPSQQLTGITEDRLQQAPHPEDALLDFYRFAGNRPLIAHNGFGYDFPLLDAALSKLGVNTLRTPRLDTLDLAHVLFPRAGRGMVRNSDGTTPPPSRTLDDLAAHLLGVEPRRFHRALDDARLTHRVLVEMLGRLDEDRPVFNLQRWILGTGVHPWSKFLQPHGERVPLEEVVPAPRPGRCASATGNFDISALVRMFQKDGVLMGKGRQPRDQQIKMAELCAKALSQKDLPRLLIEAPTGTGKTLAYLVPAIEYARASKCTVIVAPHSKVLQNQVLSTLEELQDDLGEFNSVLLKGRNSYISLESLAAELDDLETQPDKSIGDSPSPTESERDTAMTLALAILCGWVSSTPTGDWDDLRTWAIESHVPALRGLRRLLRIEEPSSAPEGPLERLDFHRRARDELKNAHVAVLNHALLVLKEDWIVPPEFLIVDEAHNLEDSVTGALSEEVDDEGLQTLCSALWDPVRRRGAAQRLAAAGGVSLRSPSIQRLRQAANAARKAVEAFRQPLVDFLRTRTGTLQEEASRYPMSYRIRQGIDTRRFDYRPVTEAGSKLSKALWEIAEALNDITVPPKPRGRYRQWRLEEENARLGRQARDEAKLILRVLGARDPESWISIGQVRFTGEQWRWTLRRVPVSVDSQLRELWQSLTAFVLTSATLSVNGGFEHIISRLGLDAVRAESLDSPFTRMRENHLVLLTDYLPTPRHRSIEEFRNSTASELPRLFTLTGGRGMALMTARARMEFVRDHARPILEAEGLPLLAQGDAPSPALAERMRTERTTSLLAVRSFWEGIDLPGENLSLLAIEKVPFDSPADPIVGARMELMERRGGDPFADYMVPRAALRFAQGVGRLIRTEKDRGVTVVLDNRLRRPTPYRDRVLQTLPGPPTFKRVDSANDTYRGIADHLGDVRFDDQMLERLLAIPSADPWADLGDLELTHHELSDETVVRDRLEKVRERFDFNEWRPGQLETMVRFMRDEDVLAVLPTGAGKSITFQIPALLCPGVTLVISPLTALMNDQTDNLRSRRLTKVAAIHAGVSQGEQTEILRGARNGLYKLLYVSPERLWSPMFLYNARRMDLARVAVDEAHCISQWGHSFRTEYAAIPQALTELSELRPPILAVTATATPRVRKEIVDLLGLDVTGSAVIRSPDRPEIKYYVERCRNTRADRDLRVVQVVEAHRQKGALVYVPRRSDTTRLAGLLRSAGHVVRPYHGGMEQPERQHVEDAFRHGEIDVVVATKAFGMGIDKPDIALIVHLEMPSSIEEYIQETGRVARGASVGVGPETGVAVLLVTPRDSQIHRYFVRSATTDLDQVKSLWSRLQPGKHPFDPDGFNDSEDGDFDRQGLAMAVSYLEEQGALCRHPDIVRRGRITTVAYTSRMIQELKEDDPDLALRAQRIIEVLDSIGSEEYNWETWEGLLGRDPVETELDLLELHRRDILGFAAWEYAWVLERLADTEPDWGSIARIAKRRRAAVEDMSREAKSLAHDEHRCRRAAMMRYLGVETAETCGGCDACTPELPRPWADSTITRESLVASLPKEDTILQLIGDMAGRQVARTSIVRALTAGGGKYPLSESLTSHPAFGQLSFLGKEKTNQTIDSLIGTGQVSEEQAEFNNKKYTTLTLTNPGTGI